MNDPDVSNTEMRKFRNISEQELNRVIAGHGPETDDELKDLTRFFNDLSEAYPETSTEIYESAHVAAMIRMSQILAENGDPVFKPVSKANGPVHQVSGLPKLRRSIMLRIEHASMKMKAAAAGLAMVIMFGGTAIAGVLPAPVQNAVAKAAHGIGINLPDSEDDAMDNPDETIEDNQNEDAADDPGETIGEDVTDDSDDAIEEDTGNDSDDAIEHDQNEDAVDDSDDAIEDDQDDQNEDAENDSDDAIEDDQDDQNEDAENDSDDTIEDDQDDANADETDDNPDSEQN